MEQMIISTRSRYILPFTPYRSSSKVRDGLKVGKDFVTRGVKRLVKLFRKRVSVERMFGRAKEWLLLDHL
jgi:aminoglycoside N3'-acetyltransferase